MKNKITIISSKGHRGNGWLPYPNELLYFIRVSFELFDERIPDGLRDVSFVLRRFKKS